MWVEKTVGGEVRTVFDSAVIVYWDLRGGRCLVCVCQSENDDVWGGISWWRRVGPCARRLADAPKLKVAFR